MMRLLLICLALSACSNSNNDPSGDDAPEPDACSVGCSSGSVTPQVGQWFYNEAMTISSTCPSSVSNGTGNFLIDSASSSMFHIVPGDGTAPFNCNLSGKAFDCPDRAASTQDLRPGIDAVLSARAVANGTFENNTQASGRQDITVTCAGTQCNATGASFPCTVKIDFAIRAR